jgi:hypothetical protein
MATTADSYFPYDAGAGANVSEAQWRTFMGGINTNGVVSGYLNGLAVTGDSTGMQVKLATGGIWANGAYGENTSGVQTISLAASHATLNRYDLIVARNDYTNNRIEWDVVQGTNGASPTVPTVTQNASMYEIALAYVYIAATVTTITAANVTDQRQYNTGNNTVIKTVSPVASASSMVIDNIPARKYLKVKAFCVASGSISLQIRFNSDSGSNYAIRQSANGAADATAGSQTSLIIYSSASRQSAIVDFDITNTLAHEKMGFATALDGGAAGAASFAGKADQSIKWANTAAQINRVEIFTSAGSYTTASSLTVIASDIPF